MRRFLDGMDTAPPHRPSPPRVIAALGPKMLELARDRAGGSHPYLVTPRHTAAARRVLGGGKVLAPEQAFVLEPDPGRARGLARKHLEPYLTMENYRRNWLRDGFSERDLARGGSDRLVDELVAWGEPAKVATEVERHFEAGADHVALQAIGPDPVHQLRRLADAIGL
jgi:probable F420-dependent oxidoreductase